MWTVLRYFYIDTLCVLGDSHVHLSLTQLFARLVLEATENL